MPLAILTGPQRLEQDREIAIPRLSAFLPQRGERRAPPAKSRAPA